MAFPVHLMVMLNGLTLHISRCYLYSKSLSDSNTLAFFNSVQVDLTYAAGVTGLKTRVCF